MVFKENREDQSSLTDYKGRTIEKGGGGELFE